MPNNECENKILIIEDDPMQIIMYEVAFKNFGYYVITANTGKKGVDKAKKELPNVILLDLLLGESSGMDVLKNIKSASKTKDLKVVIMTNFMKKDLAKECLEAGADEFLIKSDFTPKELAQKIKIFCKCPK